MSVSSTKFLSFVVFLGLAGGLAAMAPSARPGDEGCSPGGLDDKVTAGNYEGLQWTVHYSNDEFLDDGENGDYVPSTTANKIAGGVTYSDLRHRGDWGFGPPNITTAPDANIYVYDSKDGGAYRSACITVDAPKMRSSPDSGLQLISHEIFHARQFGYLADVAGDYEGFGDWTIEGTARCLDDRYNDSLDNTGKFLADSNRLMDKEHEDLGPYRNLSLFDHSYRACLFWSYCCEQLGDISIEPDRGVDFIRSFWEAAGADMEEDDVRDAVATLNGVIQAEGGTSLEQLWHDFTICLLTREWDASALPNAARYLFLDEQPGNNAGGADMRDMLRTTTHDAGDPFPQSGGSRVETFGHRYFELENITGSFECEVIGVNASAEREVGWALIGVRSGDAVVLSKQRGKEYVQAFFLDPDHPLDSLGLVVTGFGEAADFDYTFDRGPFSPLIVRPTADEPEHPGPYDDPERIVARVRVEGPDGLKPDGVGPRSIKGLRAADFAAEIGGLDARVLSAAYIGDEYWLVLDAPPQPANGAYDLSVFLCPDSTIPFQAFSADSVVYDDVTRNHMLVVDRSGSMQYPDDGSGSKLDAVKKAMALYIDAVNSNDRVGVVAFSGNGTECNADSNTELSIGIATDIQRFAAIAAVEALTPNGWTSIGDGLWDAQDEFDALPAGETNANSIVLLSDGQENEARFWAGEITCPGDLGDSARSRLVPADTAVNAIALGPEANQSLMQAIGDETEGDWSYVDVSDSAGPSAGVDVGLYNDLGDAYMRLLEKARDLERISFFRDTAPGGQTSFAELFVPESGLRQATLFFHWPDGAGHVVIRLFDPNGSEIGPSQAQIFIAGTHKVYHLNTSPMGGPWRVRIEPDNDVELIGGLLAKNPSGVELLTVVTQIPTGGPLELINTFGPFEWGVPVLVKAILTEPAGVIANAVVTATVELPDGSPACPLLTLRDDGTGGDDLPGDGVYTARFTNTSQAGLPTGVVNDDPGNPNPGGESGTYLVDITAVSGPNEAPKFARIAAEAFHVFRTDTTLDDTDLDGLPDTWEKYYGTDTTVDDSLGDPDGDLLSNRDEFLNGCDPFDQDTDDGGESDRSEVGAGRCPLDPVDDSLPCPMDVGVVTHPEHGPDDILQSLALRLRFPSHPAYELMNVYRSTLPIPETFALVAQLPPAEFQDGVYYDEDLVDGQTYYYRFQAIGLSGSASCMSRIVQGTARLDPVPPQGWVFINSGSERSGRLGVLLTLNLSTSAQWYRVSNDQVAGSGVPWSILPPTPYVNWTLDAAPGESAWVYVQYFNSISGVVSQEVVESILYDPFGDFDGDGLANFADPDDDDDGLPDVDEVFIHHTDAFKVDSDEDGLDDDFEALHDCFHPRNPDTDGDGVLDGDDPACTRRH